MRSSLRFLLALLFFTSLAFAQQPLVKQINLAEMTDSAAAVVRATVSDVASEPHPNYPNVGTTRVTLRVLESALGNPGQSLTIRLYDPGAKFSPKTSKIIHPAFRVGEELVLFVYPNSSYGLTSIIGGEQGRFRVEHEGTQTFVVNSFGNRGLFTGVSKQLSARGATATAAQSSMLTTSSGRSELGSFFGLVRQLAAAKEAK